jgi:nucleoside-diphosphate-sugar epimerase
VSKAKRLLGFEAKVPLATGLARTLDWHRETQIEKRLAWA